ncbi:MAG: DUF2911 domain-containing protein [Bacteroidia bacterium]|nr:DUF2911 domain-containing protein [Bacteroidia bacterium]
MKHLSTFAFLLLFVWFGSHSATAQLRLPQPSPHATVSQTIGLTDITIDYSSPGVKGRTIFGGLVPYDKIWRTGANSATTITFSNPVEIEGTNVPEGTYSVFTIPGEAGWLVILNKNKTASTGDYKEAEDLMRIKVKPQASPFRERMAFLFSDFTDNQGTINLEWDKTRVSFVVKTPTEKFAEENINNVLGGSWRAYNSAARYMMEKKNYDKALEYVDKSINLTSDWFNNWTKSQVLSELGKKADALKYAQTAKMLGDKSEGFFFKDQVEKAIADLSGAKK